MVVAHGREAPAAAEWDAFIAECRELGDKIKRMLVFTAGGSLDAGQRVQVEREFGKLQIAVLTDSLVVRGVVTALSWFRVPIAAFAPDQLARAMDHIKVPPDERDTLRKGLARAKARVL